MYLKVEVITKIRTYIDGNSCKFVQRTRITENRKHLWFGSWDKVLTGKKKKKKKDRVL